MKSIGPCPGVALRGTLGYSRTPLRDDKPLATGRSPHAVTHGTGTTTRKPVKRVGLPANCVCGTVRS